VNVHNVDTREHRLTRKQCLTLKPREQRADIEAKISIKAYTCENKGQHG